MDLGLQGRRALVTGSTAGIGLATARQLAAEGAAVVVNGRTAARVDDAVAQIRAAVPNADVRGVAADLATADGCARLVAAAAEGVTKTAQVAVARGLAESTAGSGVTVNSVLPGPTASEGVATFVGQMAEARGVDFATMEREFFATARPSSLLQRFATPDEIAAMIVYVCSARAAATNGAALRVDGGVVRAIL